MKKWQYLVLTLHAKSLADLNRDLGGAGDDGWELVGMSEHYMIFKRPA